MAPAMCLAVFEILALSLACGQRSTAVPVPTADPPPGSIDGALRTPADYVLVGPRGSTAFAIPPAPSAAAAGALTGTPVGPGYGFVVTGERFVGDRRYVHIGDGRWLPAADLTRARPSPFAGTALATGEPMRFGWVTVPQTTVRQRPAPAAPAITTRAMHTRLVFSGACRSGWCPLAVGWVRATDLALPAASPRPGRVGPVEPWLDIDLTTQTLVAYRGDEPVYATLVSTGIGERGSPLATPTGTFTIRSKHRLVRMDNLEHTGVVAYAYDVPLAQYFAEGKALHAALWHDRFGHPTSHGCVNLGPRDAEWLFAFTTPVVPRGTSEIAAGASRAGTVVRVRGQLPTIAVR
jgi:hypothetical protein